MDLLARREHSHHELFNKLTRKGHGANDVRQALTDLAATGLQSDARFAASLIIVRTGQGKGPLRVRADLAKAGVDDDLIEQSLAESGVNWAGQACKVLVGKFGRQPPQDYAEKARRMRFLNQRGFTMDEISTAIREIQAP